MDFVRAYTDKELEKIEKRLRKEYRQATKEMQRKFEKSMERFKVRDDDMRKRLKAGTMSKSEYIAWRKRAIFSGTWLHEATSQLALDLSVINKEATEQLATTIPSVYGECYNRIGYASYLATGASVSFSLYDKKTVEVLAKTGKIWLPEWNGDKDKAWNYRRFNSAISQSILQGESIPNSAKRIRSVVNADRVQSMRAARTAINSVENAARFERGEEIKESGMKVEKEWIATHDARTRESHRELDGKIVDIDEEFADNLMFAGDMNADPEELYNCRCTTALLLDGHRIGSDISEADMKEWEKGYQDWKNGANIVEKNGVWVNG